MPLVLVLGLPGSGKSRRAEELRAALAESCGCEAFVVSEASAGEGRSALRAEAERLLGGGGGGKKAAAAVVIVDGGGSEVKSFRYELFCLSKQARAPHCLLLCPGGAPRPDRPPLEPPDPRQRWDRPLFLAPADPDQLLPLDDIRAALFERRPPAPNRSTRSQPLQAAGFLHRLDRLTLDVQGALLEAQRNGAQPGEFVPVALEAGGEPGPEDSPQGLLLRRPVGLAELSRLRRQFLSYAKMNPGEGEQDLPRLGNMFLQYLSQNLA